MTLPIDFIYIYIYTQYIYIYISISKPFGFPFWKKLLPLQFLFFSEAFWLSNNHSLFYYLPLVYTKPCVSTSKLAVRIFNQGVHHVYIYIYICTSIQTFGFSTNVNILCHTLLLVLLEVLWLGNNVFVCLFKPSGLAVCVNIATKGDSNDFTHVHICEYI